MATLGKRYASGRLRALIWGPAGSAKTVNSHMMPRTRTLDLDDGMMSVMWAIKEGLINKDPDEIVYETILEHDTNRNLYGLVTETTVLDRMTDQVDKWLWEERLSDEEWKKELEKRAEIDPDNIYEDRFWDTLIVDSATGMTDASINKGLDENARLKLSHSKNQSQVLRVMRQQDWGAAASLFRQAIEQWKSLDKNLIVIAHEYVDRDDSGTVLGVKPAAIGQLRDQLPTMFDEVYYAHVTGSRTSPEFKFQTLPGNKRLCRSRLGCLDPIIPADFQLIRERVAEYYDLNPEELWTRARASDRPMAASGKRK